jgi:hypothetical protein
MCVILFSKINNKYILAKNRDRVYKPRVKIIHEMIDGVEIAYIYELHTGWIEGINQYGIGIVNSTLNIHDGKTRKKHIKKRDLLKGKKILEALTEKTIESVVQKIIKNENFKRTFFEGHTLVCSENKCFHIECVSENEHTVNEVDRDSVFTNSGVLYNAGYIRGKKGLSSALRKKLIEAELKTSKIENLEDILDIMNKNYSDLDPRFHPYRDQRFTRKHLYNKENVNKPAVSTTSQMLLNLEDKELIYKFDTNNSEFVGFVNKLPKKYRPHIKIKVHETTKHTMHEKTPLNKQTVKKLYTKFMKNKSTKTTNIKKITKKNKTRKIK